MVDILSDMLDFNFSIVSMFLIARYIYREKLFKRIKSWTIFFVLCNILLLISLLTVKKDEIYIVILVLAFIIVIFITRKKRRIRGVFLFIPVLGFILGMYSIPIAIFMIFSNRSIWDSIYNEYFIFITDLFIGIITFCLVYNVRKWRVHYDSNEELEKEFLQGLWERRLLNSCGLLLFIISTFIEAIKEEKLFIGYEKYIFFISVIILIIILSSIIMIVIKSSSINYYRELSNLNEYYINAQLNHFKAYKETQRETRRIRHDMKNHIICISTLYKEKKYDTLGKYIKGLEESVLNIDNEFHVGNDVADAIINEKNILSKKYNIDINIEGDMLGIDNIEPIDICTIFSNSIDNAIEGINKYNGEKKIINIKIRKNDMFLVITVMNPTNELKNPHKQRFFTTTKGDIINHGFGLENIKRVAEKYNGYVNIEIENIDGENFFIIEMMIKLNNVISQQN